MYSAKPIVGQTFDVLVTAPELFTTAAVSVPTLTPMPAGSVEPEALHNGFRYEAKAAKIPFRSSETEHFSSLLPLLPRNTIERAIAHTLGAYFPADRETISRHTAKRDG